MNLLALQTAFHAEISAEDGDAVSSAPGMAIYRDAYRGRLLAALETSFERTLRWVGTEAFTAAACHYILTSPPRAWSLDDYGADFPDLLGTLFAGDPEVGELAWLEWHLQAAFAAPDAARLDAAALATAGYGNADWDRLGFTMAAGFASRAVTTNASTLWAALADSDGNDFRIEQMADARLLVWRSNLSPHFRMAEEAEFGALERLGKGGRLGVLAEGTDTARLSSWLSQWLGEGIFAHSMLR